MPSMHTLRKIPTLIIAFALLAAVSDVIIFHRGSAADFLRADVIWRVHHGFFEPAIAILMGLALLGFLIVLRRVTHNLAAFARYLWGAPDHALKAEDQNAAEKELRTNRIQVITTVVQSLGGSAVLIGIYFAWANLRTTQEAQKDTQKNQTETLRITTEGQITDRFTKAIDQLGATDNQGNPRLEIRLGGIYALERIARESPEDYGPIMEVLTTYVRVHAPVKKTDEQKVRQMDEQLDSGSSKANNGTPSELMPTAPPSPDIQAILTVLGRLNGEKNQLVLQNTELSNADLNGAHLEGARLYDAHLEGASLGGACLGGGRSCTARIWRGARLIDAHLEGAFLGGAHLERAHLRSYLFSPDVRGLTQAA
jgi:pentapeptide repeat protein